MSVPQDCAYPISSFHREVILITVKTYPIPHARHHESVCTAGINDRGEWRRLWPIPFRFLERSHRFRRYEWVHALVRKQASDQRKESYVVDPDSITRGACVPAGGAWQARRDLLQPHACRSVEELRLRYRADRTSMGFLRPRAYEGLSLRWLKESAWSAAQSAQTQQQQLLSAARPLQELPFRLRLSFVCDDPACKGHTMNITDWEVGAFFFRRFRQLDDAHAAAEATRDQFARLFADDYDTWLYVGTLGPVRPSFIVTGLFYPRRSAQTSLFDDLGSR